jgi:hypothetical protein
MKPITLCTFNSQIPQFANNNNTWTKGNTKTMHIWMYQGNICTFYITHSSPLYNKEIYKTLFNKLWLPQHHIKQHRCLEKYKTKLILEFRSIWISFLNTSNLPNIHIAEIGTNIWHQHKQIHKLPMVLHHILVPLLQILNITPNNWF